MELSTLIELSDVSGSPQARLALPGPLRIGDRLKLGFRLKREKGGRDEELDASGEWRVTSVGFDASGPYPRQVVVLESTTKTPTWRAVKKTASWRRTLPPAHAPRTVLS
jgi:hypothetical protein